MKFIFTQCYQDGYRLLDRDKQSLVKHALDLFQDDPFDPFLNNHLLRKPLGSKRTISVDDDLRIIFQIKGEYREILLLDVGDHDRVYK